MLLLPLEMVFLALFYCACWLDHFVWLPAAAREWRSDGVAEQPSTLLVSRPCRLCNRDPRIRRAAEIYRPVRVGREPDRISHRRSTGFFESSAIGLVDPQEDGKNASTQLVLIQFLYTRCNHACRTTIPAIAYPGIGLEA